MIKNKIMNRLFNFGAAFIVFVIIATIVFWVFVAKLILNVSEEATNTYNNTNAQLKELVGKHIVLNNDTLTVIDYFTAERSVTLSNGQKVSLEFVEKFKIEDLK